MQTWQEFNYSARDGMKLAGRKYGWQNDGAMAVVCLAGLSRNSKDFHELAEYLASNDKTPRRVLTLDYRGRGQSEYDKNWGNYNPVSEAEDVVNGMIAAGLGQAHFIGTSRGGLVIMALAAMRPVILGSIVFNDIGPAVDGVGLVRIKTMLDSSHYARDWAEATKRIREANERDFPKLSQADWERQARLIFREHNDPSLAKNGSLVRDFDEGLISTLKAIDLDTPLPELWPQFEGLRNNPLMLIRGKNSDLLSPQIVEKMREIHPKMIVREVADAGHAPDVGTPELAKAIGDFLRKSEG